MTHNSEYYEILVNYLPLGLTAFGGPAAHIGLYHNLFVEKLKWISPLAFSSFFGIHQALPGPASTQLGFTIALLRHGLGPAIFSFVLWSFPAWIVVTTLACIVSSGVEQHSRWVLWIGVGLAGVAIGLILIAAVKLCQKLIKENWEIAIWLLSICCSISSPQSWVSPAIIGGGGILAIIQYYSVLLWNKRKGINLVEDLNELKIQNNPGEKHGDQLSINESKSPESSLQSTASKITAETSAEVQITVPKSPTQNLENELDPRHHIPSLKSGSLYLLFWTITLFLCFLLRGILSSTNPTDVTSLSFILFMSIYITGSIIFGGGPVVIPLLYSYVVTPGYMTASQFVLGLSIQQILPGPNFNFAAFCGGVGLASIMDPLSQNIPSKIAYAIFGAVVGNIAIFIPGLVINLGVLPFHKSFTRNKLFQVLLQGIRAAAIGLVWGAAFWLWVNAVDGSSVKTGDSFGLVDHSWVLIIIAITCILSGWLNFLPIWCVLIGALSGLIQYSIHG